MEKIESLEQYLQNNKEEIIQETKLSIKGLILLIIGIIMVVAGIIANQLSISTIAVICGLTIVIFGLINCVQNSQYYKDKQSDKKFKKYKYYISAEDARNVSMSIERQSYTALSGLKKQQQSGHLLEIYATDNNEVVIFQMSEFIPHNFVPTTDVVRLVKPESDYLSNLIKSK